MKSKNSNSCLVCKENNCACLSSLTRYAKILESANQRISSSNSASSNIIKGIGCIDKLSFELQTPVYERQFLDNLKSIGISFKVTKLRNQNNFFYQIGDSKLRIYCPKPFSTSHIKYLITNPSSFIKHEDWLKRIASLLPLIDLHNTRVFRLDLAVDYEVSFKMINQNLDCKYKRVKIEFLSKSGQWTGMNIGSGNEKFVIYDHKERHRGSQPKTRIECQIKGAKIPISSIVDISMLPERLKARNPFSALELKSVQTCSLSDYSSERDQRRIKKLKVLIEYNGFLSARKKLNTHRNFKRDYEKYLRFEENFEQPADIIFRSLTKYTRKK